MGTTCSHNFAAVRFSFFRRGKLLFRNHLSLEIVYEFRMQFLLGPLVPKMCIGKPTARYKNGLRFKQRHFRYIVHD